MMHDIVSGKIKIRRASSAQASRRGKLDNRVSFRGQFNLGKERSKTEMKGSNKNIVKRDSSKKLTFQQGLRIVEENSKVFPPIKKIDIFPKKTTLKLNQDYRPIREASKQAQNTRGGSKQHEKTDVNLPKSGSQLKLKLRSNLQPKIINL